METSHEHSDGRSKDDSSDAIDARTSETTDLQMKENSAEETFEEKERRSSEESPGREDSSQAACETPYWDETCSFLVASMCRMKIVIISVLYGVLQ